MDADPLSAVGARDLARSILESGSVRFSKHARDQIQKRVLSEQDITNTLRGGHVKSDRGITFENGSWRYTIETQRIAVVVAFASKESLVIVTAWRIEP